MNGWVSLKDQEPPKDQPVLITDGEVIVVALWTDRHKGMIEVYRGPRPASPDDFPVGKPFLAVPVIVHSWRARGFGRHGWELAFEGCGITHWQPLPELPGKGKT